MPVNAVINRQLHHAKGHDQLEVSILPEVRPPKFVVIDGRQYGEDMDAAKESYFAAHPEDRGAPLVIFLRDIAGEKAAKRPGRKPDAHGSLQPRPRGVDKTRPAGVVPSSLPGESRNAN